VVCIDHHSTALDKVDELKEYCDETYIQIGPGLSGATLVWKYFNERFGESLETPLLLRYVADQDIWEWKLEDSKEVNAALNVLNGTVEEMSVELDACLADPAKWLAERKMRGGAIVAMVDSQVHRAARQVVELVAGDVTLLVVNSTSFNSELGNYLCEHHENSPNAVAMIYTIQDDWAVRCSIRSIPGGRATARKIAERYGGGGHEHASGCRFGDFEKFRAALDELVAGG
jgi:oligoribonuclease NrnB/cAMP/cGMP phosphodiesterase (DHH superfamily)